MIRARVRGDAHHRVVVVGAGQAGLALSHELVARGVDHLVLERESVAHEWRDGRWDAFTLVTPNWHCRLPGYAYDGPDPDGFMRRDEVYRWVRRYADTFDAPVAEGVAVTRLARRERGGFVVSTSAGVVTADVVVAAVGGYHRPVTPGWAGALPRRVVQVHSHRYRSADRLPPGPVLVVGTGQSGTQIAEDLLLAGREVHLAAGRAPRVARRYRGRDCMTWLAEMGVYDVPVAARGLAKRESTNHYVTGRDGGRDIDLRDFARRGMHLYGRATGVGVDASGAAAVTFAPTLAADLDHADAVAESIKDDIDRHIAARGISAPVEPRYTPVWRPDGEPTSLPVDRLAAVVWSVGFRADWSWLGPLVGAVLDDEGHPRHVRGLSPEPGLAFLGLPWQHTWGSGRFLGVAQDARHLAERLVAGGWARSADELAVSVPAAAVGG
ncbi:MSMEG_0569 family flavin-dependent oxidoreductase [Cellulomonas dongxiuzhuiae]|uniref:MSMEG_0569 family flavin-dependent oxidoreductase n=1 Tax=Cellulomonas dongxiuzhuiae TaxID=2819979 RepID=A0ABX8GGG7_9CELL|nr:MSMEG_0569 family flavin-dependent oxidoreductase [Cellulomonas dongxiuzhuiae]MBO3093496.1 MSMEG_0569 family flavin-dependent oxidoreductase [Cellulomonas dongxiuzhuiae]QWC14629.1 MSMEG_0569 family flavin-dependent oxidoreductase [Cellulomonas dongxiuzhuiae]